MIIWAAFFIIFFLVNILYKKTNAYQNKKIYFQKFDTGVPSGLEMVNVGSGPSYYAINYDSLPIEGFNFAIPPQSVYHDLAFLKHYRNSIKKHAIIIIGITCPLSFSMNKFHRKADYRCRYYGILETKEIDGGNQIEKFLYQYFPLILFPKRIIRLVKDVPETDLSDRKEDVEENAEKMLTGWIANNYIYNLRDDKQAEIHQDEFRRVIEAYKEMLQLCKEEEWHPYFVIPPASETIRKYISAEFRQVFVLDNMAEANIYDIPVLDYFSDERFAGNEYFRNSMFLNDKGSKKFTEILWEDIKDCDKTLC